MLCLQCGSICGRDLDCDKSRHEMVRNRRNLDLGKNAKNQLERPSHKCVCFGKMKEKRKKNAYWIQYGNENADRWGLVLRNEVLLVYEKLLKEEGRAKCPGEEKHNVLSDLVSLAQCPEVKRAAEDTEGRKTKEEEVVYTRQSCIWISGYRIILAR